MNLKLNTFMVFKNRRKMNDKHPDMTGELLCECQHCHETNEFDVSIWGATTKTDKPMLKGTVRVPDFESEYYKKKKLADLKALEEYKKTPEEKEKDLPF